MASASKTSAHPNAIDKNGNNIAKCDESWSLDNLKIRAVNYD